MARPSRVVAVATDSSRPQSDILYRNTRRATSTHLPERPVRAGEGSPFPARHAWKSVGAATHGDGARTCVAPDDGRSTSAVRRTGYSAGGGMTEPTRIKDLPPRHRPRLFGAVHATFFNSATGRLCDLSWPGGTIYIQGLDNRAQHPRAQRGRGAILRPRRGRRRDLAAAPFAQNQWLCFTQRHHRQVFLMDRCRSSRRVLHVWARDLRPSPIQLTQDRGRGRDFNGDTPPHLWRNDTTGRSTCAPGSNAIVYQGVVTSAQPAGRGGASAITTVMAIPHPVAQRELGVSST